jgi:signal transduction histidine kinase/ligand-binding sensor domain-containing protein
MFKDSKQIIIIVATILSSLLSTAIPVSALEISSDDYVKFETITTEQGLSQNCVVSILQDHYGYIWFGTMVGLNKYDGINFEIFYASEASRSISNSCITYLYETKDAQLWIGTAKGLNLYNREMGIFYVYLNDPEDRNSISDDFITNIYEDSLGNLWVGTANGLNLYNSETNDFTVISNNSGYFTGISSNYVMCIYEDSYGTLWIGTKEGLNIYDRETGMFTSYFNNPDDVNSISNDNISVVYEDSRGILWIGTAKGLNLYKRESDTFTKYFNDPENSGSVSSNTITSICEDIYGYLWVGTRSGLNKLDTELMIFTDYCIDNSNLNSINSDRIIWIEMDNEGILWIGTVNGVNKLNPNKQVFNYSSGILVNNNVSGICSLDNTILWLETRLGIIVYNADTHSIEDYYPDILWQQYQASFVMNLFCIDNNGCLWGGTENSGLLKFDPYSKKTIIYTHSPDGNSIISDSIVSVYSSDGQIIWIGTDEGLCSFNIRTEAFTDYSDYEEYPDVIKYSNVWVTFQDSRNNMWFGTDYGIYKLDYGTHDFYLVNNNPEPTGGYFERSVYSIYEDSNGLLWFGTNQGLLCYDYNNAIFISYGDEEFVVKDSVLSVIEDNNGNIWFTTRKQGLWELSIETGSLIEYGIKDGLQNDAFCIGACFKAEDGNLYFGCVDGLISFNPEYIDNDASIPPVVLINSFNLLDKNISFDEPIEDIEEIRLSYSDNSFEIDFVALNYYSPENNNYAYILEGFDESWRYCSASESFTKYTNIPSGEYTFKVIASNSDGVWNEEGTSLKIIITSPFWQEWWFILSLAIFAILAIVFFVKLRTRVLSRHAMELEQQIDERTHLLASKSEQLENELVRRAEFNRALVHELKTPLTPLLSSSEYLMNSIEDDITLGFMNNIRQGILNLEKRINELMDLARGEVGLIKLNCVYIYPLHIIKDSIAYFMPEAQKKNQGIIMDLPDSLTKIYADEERLKQVILNLLNNASKFTRRGGEITLKAWESNDKLIIEVIDTGCGIDEVEQKYIFEPYSQLRLKKESLSGLGLGLYLSKLFIELHGGSIWVISCKGKGSTFAFSLPLNNNTSENNNGG